MESRPPPPRPLHMRFLFDDILAIVLHQMESYTGTSRTQNCPSLLDYQHDILSSISITILVIPMAARQWIGFGVLVTDANNNSRIWKRGICIFCILSVSYQSHKSNHESHCHTLTKQGYNSLCCQSVTQFPVLPVKYRYR